MTNLVTEINKWEEQLKSILKEFSKQAQMKKGQILIVGCSTSEVAGQRIGTAGTDEIAAMIFTVLKDLQEATGVALAFQCCEHLNRALVIDRDMVWRDSWEEVTVIPVRHAGGAMATYAYNHFANPAVIEYIKGEAGIDIGDTFIGMHLKPVAVPIRVSHQSVGYAHVTLATTRPKLIGGSRAQYERTAVNESC